MSFIAERSLHQVVDNFKGLPEKILEIRVSYRLSELGKPSTKTLMTLVVNISFRV